MGVQETPRRSSYGFDAAALTLELICPTNAQFQRRRGVMNGTFSRPRLAKAWEHRLPTQAKWLACRRLGWLAADVANLALHRFTPKEGGREDTAYQDRSDCSCPPSSLPRPRLTWPSFLLRR